jgi:hypothetical protein
MFRMLLSVIFTLLVTSIVFTNPPQNVPKEKNLCELTCYSGTKLNGVVATTSLKLTTKEGELVIATENINKIKVGLHAPKEEAEKINKALAGLSSNDYKTREGSSKELLKLYRYSYLPIIELVSKDKEVLERVKLLVESIKGEKDLRFLPDKSDDVVELSNGAIYIGRLQTEEFKLNTEEFGVVTSHLSNIKELHFVNNGRKNIIMLDASKYSIQWYDTGIDINGFVQISASGSIDIWPEDAGKFMAGPCGSAHPGHSEKSAGTLIGYIGNANVAGQTIFDIGEYYQSNTDKKGRLYIKQRYHAKCPNCCL